MSEIDAFDSELNEAQKMICLELHGLIEKNLKNSTSKLYHGSPVWFINENPIVGYSIKKEGVSLLFWSGQGFRNKGLKAIGKYKAAELVFKNADPIDKATIIEWITESNEVQWNYKDIIKNKGKLEPL